MEGGGVGEEGKGLVGWGRKESVWGH